MKKQLKIWFSFFLVPFSLYSQFSTDSALIEVEKNNTTLSAYRKSIDAEKIGNKTGLYPQNPEAEFNYLWGNPSVIGNRTDFNIRQSFDFPTAYTYKSQIGDLKNQQSEWDYKKQRNEILYQTRVVCIKLIYQNSLKAELNKRHNNALQIADACKARFNAGDISVLEYNKAQLYLMNTAKDLENNEIERNALLSELASLNGGVFMNFSDSLYPVQTIPADFGEWYAQVELNNPLLQWIKQEIVISEKQIRLNTAMNLPNFYAGYMSEKVVGEKFQGLTVGISIPLWENKNTTRYAKARSVALQSIETDTKLQFYNDMKASHAKVTALQKNVTGYLSNLNAFSNDQLLEIAYNKGEISLTEYIYELSIYYESYSNLLEMQMNLHMAMAKLNRYN